MSTAAKIGTREEYQLELERLYDKNQLLPRVRRAFKESKQVPFREAMERAGIPEDFGFDMLAQAAIHKRANVATMVGCLRRHCSTDQEVADLLEKAVKHNFISFELTATRGGFDGVFIVAYDVSAELQAELDRFQYPLPMVVEPAPVTDNKCTGYLTQRGSVILRDNHHEEDVCLDHINRMNKVRLSINLEVAKTIQNRWRGLDRKQADESFEDYRRRRRAFEKYCSVAGEVIGILAAAGNELRLTHAYDKRGRTYCRGFHVTYQGTDWNKAVLELADKEQLEG